MLSGTPAQLIKQLEQMLCFNANNVRWQSRTLITTVSTRGKKFPPLQTQNGPWRHPVPLGITFIYTSASGLQNRSHDIHAASGQPAQTLKSRDKRLASYTTVDGEHHILLPRIHKLEFGSHDSLAQTYIRSIAFESGRHSGPRSSSFLFFFLCIFFLF